MHKRAQSKRTPDRRNRLLIVDGQVSGKPATVLIDGGAGINAINEQFARTHGIKLRQGTERRIALAGGQRQDASLTATAEVRMQRYASRVELRATNLEGWDVLLGKPWLTDNNPRINWKENTVEIFRKGRKLVISADASRKLPTSLRNERQLPACKQSVAFSNARRRNSSD